MTREKAIEELKEMIEYEWGTYFTNTAKTHVTALEMAIKALEHLGVDCISRKVMHDLGATCIAYRNDEQELIPIISIDELPSVTPQEPKTGHWIDTNNHQYYNDGYIETTELRCSCCNEEVEWDIELSHKPYYCENCGADMREVENDTD